VEGRVVCYSNILQILGSHFKPMVVKIGPNLGSSSSELLGKHGFDGPYNM
jgi:hypothetical protein